MAGPPAPPPLPTRSPFSLAEFRAAGTSPPSTTSSTTTLAIPPQISTISLADTIADVSSFIPISLDLGAHNYYHWRHLFSIHLGRCGLRHHIDGSYPPQPTDPRWVKDDLAIIQWIYTRISTELFNLVSNDDATAADLWASLQQLFQDNSDARINALNTELRTITQGDAPVTVFCQRIKAIGDELRELGDRVEDRTLINALLVGLGDQFEKQQSFIPMLKPYPSFKEVRSILQQEEKNQARKAQRAPQVFHAAAPAATLPRPSSTSTPQPPPGWRPSPNYRGKHPIYRPPQPRPASTAPAPTTAPSPAPPTWSPQHDPWTGLVQAWSMPWSAPSPYGAPPAYTGSWNPGLRPATGSPGLLGPRPPAHVYTATPTPPPGAPGPLPNYYTMPAYGTMQASYPHQLPPPPHVNMQASGPSAQPQQPTWDQAAFINAMNNFTLNNEGTDWIFDSGASSHMSSNMNLLSACFPSPFSTITIGDGSTIPVSCTGNSYIPSSSTNFLLNNILVVPSLIKNLISVRQFCIDNQVILAFDPFGLSVKDLKMGEVLARYNSTGDLYPLHGAPTSTPRAMLASVDLWHRRLGHPNKFTLSSLLRDFCIPSSTASHNPSLCTACQCGKNVRLPFGASTTYATFPFELLHCDLWTSPVPSVSGYKYYLVLLDDYSHYIWTFPLRAKSDVHTIFLNFRQYVLTHFGLPIRFIQCDNGREFDNTQNRNFFLSQGILLRFSCPYTSPQNGKAERSLRSINDILRTLLLQASLPSKFWAETLRTATLLINIRPTKTCPLYSPFESLFLSHPDYSSLRVFGCLCFPNTASTTQNKLAPRSLPCIHLGLSDDHKGYRCFDPSSGRVLVSRHVVFDENVFPYAATQTSAQPNPSTSPKTPSPLVPAAVISAAADLLPVFQPRQPTAADFSLNSLPRQPLAEPLPIPPTASTSQPPSPTDQPPTVSPVSTVEQPNPSSSLSPTNHVETHTETPTQSHDTPPLPPRAVPIPPRNNDHVMRTRGKRGFILPTQRLNLTATTTISPIPTSYKRALLDPLWFSAMRDEFDALEQNNTWTLVPKPSGVNVVSGKWVFRHKFHADGTLARYKARWVCRGFSQQHGIDFDETFSPVVKPSTIRVVLSLAVSTSWPIHQLDVKNAFLHGTLNETVYCQQPSGFENSSSPNLVCLLQKSLYGLKQAPRAWFQRFATFIQTIGFISSKCDSSLFIFRSSEHTAYLLLYVDDIILTASSSSFLKHIISSLNREFSMTDLGPLHHFLGINVSRTKSTLFLSQRQYLLDLLSRAGMSDCQPSRTPADTGAKLSATGDPISDPTFYRSITGALQYATLTRPDISYSVQQACLFMHDPRAPHLAHVKRILRYLKGTLDHGLLINSSSPTSLTVYSDADWAGCPDTRRSTSGFCVYLGDNLVSWCSKRQVTVSRSSAEAEYRSVAHAVAEAVWLRQLLVELHQPIERATIVYCDNISAVYMASNPVQHRRTKHIEIDIHFVREKVALGEVRVLHVPTTAQFADIFTKGLPTASFTDIRSSLNIVPPDAETAGGY